MRRLYVFEWVHRHGTDLWPILSGKEPSDKLGWSLYSTVAEIEPERQDESMYVHGPLQLTDAQGKPLDILDPQFTDTAKDVFRSAAALVQLLDDLNEVRGLLDAGKLSPNGAHDKMCALVLHAGLKNSTAYRSLRRVAATDWKDMFNS